MKIMIPVDENKNDAVIDDNYIWHDDTSINETINNITETITQTVLYDNSSGSNGTITLSDSAANYSYLEIFYRDNDQHYYSTKIYSPNTKYAAISGFDSDSTTAMWFKMRTIYISGTSISTYSTDYCEVKLLAGTPTFSKSNYLYIVRVTGYK